MKVKNLKLYKAMKYHPMIIRLKQLRSRCFMWVHYIELLRLVTKSLFYGEFYIQCIVPLDFLHLEPSPARTFFISNFLHIEPSSYRTSFISNFLHIELSSYRTFFISNFLHIEPSSYRIFFISNFLYFELSLSRTFFISNFLYIELLLSSSASSR